jgi:hypothetical protein
VRPEGLGNLKKKKNSFTSTGLEPATFRLAAQCFNNYATACPDIINKLQKIKKNAIKSPAVQTELW